MGRSALLFFIFVGLTWASLPAFADDGGDGSTTTPAPSSGTTAATGTAADANSVASQKKAQNDIDVANKTNLQKGYPTTAAQLAQQGNRCKSGLGTAANACKEDTNPFGQQMTQLLPAAASLLAGASSGASQCQQMQNMFNSLKGAQSGYNSTCKTQIQKCNDDCSSAQAAAAQASLFCAGEAGITPGKIPDCMLMVSDYSTNTLQEGVDACNALQSNANAGDSNLGNILSGLGNSQNCTQDATATPVNCNDPTQAKTNPQCICALSPRSPGCQNATASTQTTPAGLGAGTDNGATPPVNPSASNNNLGSPANDSVGGGGLPGSFGDSGGNAMNSANSIDGGKAAAKGAKTDVLGGGDAGGGSATKAGATDPYGQYEKYLPGKGKERNLASVAKNAVTGAAGQTNWEKVNANFRESSGPTLLVEKGK